VEVGWLEALGEAVGRGLVERAGGLRGAAAARTEAPRRGRRATKVRALSGALRAGETVRYRQGRGEFEVKVLSVNQRAGTARLQRTADGKRVERRVSALFR
jgi:hypothetical protein